MQNHYEQLFRSFRTTHIAQEPAWFHEMRQENFAHFLKSGFPTRKLESWRFTSLSAMEKILFEPTQREMVNNTFPVLTKDALGAQIVFVDGHYMPAISSIDQLPSSICIDHIQQGLVKKPELMRAYLGQDIQDRQSLHSFNLAFLQDGLLLIVPKNEIVTVPIHMVFFSTEQSKEKMSCVRNLIILEEGAQVTLVEEHIALENNSQLQNMFTQIDIKSAALLNYCKLQHATNGSFHYAQTYVRQAKDSSLKAWQLAGGSKIMRDDLDVGLLGQGASCEIHGLYLPEGEQHVDFHTTVRHEVPHTVSLQQYHGVLAKQASAVFNGKVHVLPQAKQINATQSNHNLLLSKQAQVNTKPELEIYADDVKCSHGATVGQLDESALFYLRSRGINKTIATRLLLQGFMHAVINDLPNENIKNHVIKLLDQRMEDFSIID